MKRLLLIIILISQTIFMFSDEPVYLKTIRVNGQEKEVKAKLIGETSYDQDGNLIYLKNRGESPWVIYYDEEGKREKIITAQKEDELYWYEYNNQTKQIEYKESDFLETIFVYDENGNCIQERYEAYDMFVDYEYDERGNKTKKVKKNDGKITVETTYEYDKNNNLIREDTNDHTVSICKYGKNNRLLRQTILINKKIRYVIKHTYDDKNNTEIITNKSARTQITNKIKRNSNGEEIYREEEWTNLETGEKSLMQREYYYDEKQNLLFTVEKNGDKITTHYYENYYDNDKLIYQMKYLIVE